MAWGWSIGSGSFGLIRVSLTSAGFSRALLASAFVAAAFALAGCNTDDTYQIPSRAMKELSPEILTQLDQKNMPKESPILIRLFKEESELEVWKQNTGGRYDLLKVYPICRWSGELGPKVREGDRQAPEGFYAITPGLMNPNSNYYLAINIGFPNAFDRANGRTGAFLMIHGDCSSRGCYAMTDEQIGEIYSLARESFLGGQKSFQIQAYPFRMTAANLARHRTNPNMPFWNNLKEGNDHFLVSHLEPKVDVCDRHYVFDAQPPANATNKSLVFTPTGRCPAYELPEEVGIPLAQKQKNDDYQIAQMTNANSPVAPVTTGTDGGMNRVFVAKLDQVSASYDNEGHLHAPPVHPGMPAPTLSSPHSEPETTSSIASAQSSGGFFKKLFGGSSSGQTTQVAAADTGEKKGFFASLFGKKDDADQAKQADTRGTETAAAKPAKPASAAGLKPRPAEPAKAPDTQIAAAKPDPKAKAKPTQEANAAPPAPSSNGMLNGAQPVMPSGSFDSRWGGLQ
jgi:murein L,D-transpeptidase YafK